jgi:hypothetical protein
VFHQGRIAERGCFEDLLLRDGQFAELVASQLTRTEPASIRTLTPPRPSAHTQDVCEDMILAEAAD